MKFIQALKSQRLIVTYEVIIGIQRLIHVSGRDLTEPTWDVLCEILRTIADNIRYYGNEDIKFEKRHKTKLLKCENFKLQRKMMGCQKRMSYRVPITRHWIKLSSFCNATKPPQILILSTMSLSTYVSHVQRNQSCI